MMNRPRRNPASLVVLALLLRFPAAALGQDKVRAASETGWGLHTATFETPRGKITVYLPDDLSAGDTISGTVIAEPTGKTEAERAKNQHELNGYVVEIEGQRAPVLDKVFKWVLPTSVGASTSVILRDKRGKELARTQCPVQQPAASVPPGRPGEPTQPGGQPPFTPQPKPADYQLPTLGQAGRPIEIKGPCNGDFGNTKVEIGGKEAQLLAESPRKVIAQSPTDVTGPTTINVKEGDVTVRGPLRNVSVSMSATKTTLHKGESATVTVIVEGLRKFDFTQDYELLNPVEIEIMELMRERGMESLPLPKLILHNATPGVVGLDGGDLQTIPVRPEDVSLEGTFTFTRTLTGIRPGGFAIKCQAQETTDEDKLPWEEDPKAEPKDRTWPKLSWEDFQGEAPEDPGGLAAQIAVEITLDWECDEGGHFTYTVKAVVDRKQSWALDDVKENPNTEEHQRLLRHEKGHFNLGEVYAKKLRKALRELKDPCKDLDETEKEVKKIFGQIRKEFSAEVDRYDDDTKHGRNKEKQEKWENKIQKDLDNLKDNK